MLGEQIGEEKGKVTGQRVLRSASGAPSMETSFQSSGKILGVGATTTGTYTAEMRPDGTLYGEGQGIVMTEDGGAATWKGGGVGVLKAGGAVSYRGAIYYQTTHQKLARLNQCAVIFEYEVDGAGNTTGKIWEWR